MGDPPIRRQLSTESQGREHLITVIVLDDLSHSLQGHGIGIHLVGVHVVEGSRLGRITFQKKGKLESVMHTIQLRQNWQLERETHNQTKTKVNSLNMS